MPAPGVPRGQRVYAIGDVHGRLDLLCALAGAIEADDAARPPAATTIILLGDLIDRGPDSAGVLRFAQDWRTRRPNNARVRIIMGNHEEMLLKALADEAMVEPFLRFGGRETAVSFGLAGEALAAGGAAAGRAHQARLRAAIPPATVAFIRSFENLIHIGDYAFVHAGIAPGRALDAQIPHDLRWIREPFLSSPAAHGAVIVHGHTITAAPVIAPNRIGIDTGAYSSGALTALGLEGTARWLFEARGAAAGATVATRPAS